MSLNSSWNSPGEVAETSVHSLFNTCVHMCSVLLVQRYCHVLYQCWVPVRGQSHLISSWVAVSFHSWETSMRRQAGCFLLSPVLPEAEWGQFFPSVLLRDSLSPGFPPQTPGSPEQDYDNICCCLCLLVSLCTSKADVDLAQVPLQGDSKRDHSNPQ